MGQIDWSIDDAHAHRPAPGRCGHQRKQSGEPKDRILFALPYTIHIGHPF
jgi:hypothetical protein